MIPVLPGARLPRVFYEQPTLAVARGLLGQRLIRVLSDGRRLGGRIRETEAYSGPDDEASHAYRRTPRSAIMYGPAGHAYIYFIYGMHYCLNAVTEREGRPGAVLIRGLWPDEGLATLRRNRTGAPDAHLADGPGKLCQALSITTAFNGMDLTTSAELFIEEDASVSDKQVSNTPRIGVRGDQAACERLWRFVWQGISDNAALRDEHGR